MLVPLSWLLTYAPLPEPVDVGEVARRLTGIGLEIGRASCRERV